MIKLGFNTLAMLTYGLGIRLPWHHIQVVEAAPPRIEFRNKPVGIAIEEKTAPTQFEDGTVDFEPRKIEFEDR